MKKILLVAKAVLLSGLSFSQTFSGSGGAIKTNGDWTYFPLTVSGLPASIDGSFGVESACVSLSHPDNGEIVMFIESPNGADFELSSGNGKGTSGFNNACFTATASTHIVNASGPFSSSYKPEGYIGSVNNHQNPNGTWRLKVKDADILTTTAGTVSSWSLSFGNAPLPPIDFTTSELPIVVINTFGWPIQDEPKVKVQMGIIYNGPGQINSITDPWNNYNSYAQIEIRGSSSQRFAKKSYGFETSDGTGINVKASLLGLPAETDWVLHAPYQDKSLLRNYLAYRMFGDMGHYSPRTRFVELVINGHYQGLYMLTEKIKKAPGRIDISKLDVTSTTPDAVSGGYIIKIDKLDGEFTGGWKSSVPAYSYSSDTVMFQYHYPEGTSLQDIHKNYIRQYVQDFETTLMGPGFNHPSEGYRKFIDTRSFIDFMIVNEVARNIDGYRLSTFLYKDRDSKNSKMFIGPVWDFDLAFGNADTDNAFMTWGWEYAEKDGFWPKPQWWVRLMQDPNFVAEFYCRYTELRNSVLSTQVLMNSIDSLTTAINAAQSRNFTKWPILGTNVWMNPTPVPTSFDGEITALKNYITGRLNWMDANVKGQCNVGVQYFHQNPLNLRVFPVPSFGEAFLSVTLPEPSAMKMEIIDHTGRTISSQNLGSHPSGEQVIPINTREYNSGMYFVNLYYQDKIYSGRFVVTNSM